jgi:hypothetical protein
MGLIAIMGQAITAKIVDRMTPSWSLKRQTNMAFLRTKKSSVQVDNIWLDTNENFHNSKF